MRLFFLTVALFSAAVSVVQAADTGKSEHLTLGAGAFNITQSDEDVSTQLSAEYRSAYLWEGLRPVVGVSADAEGGIYGYGGLNYDIFLDEHWVITPNFAAGAYHQGDSKNLGHVIEFRSGIEMGYMLENQARVSAAFNHISNASLGDKNPGAESAMLLYSHSVNLLGE